jgi:hypothetical protein
VRVPAGVERDGGLVHERVDDAREQPEQDGERGEEDGGARRARWGVHRVGAALAGVSGRRGPGPRTPPDEPGAVGEGEHGAGDDPDEGEGGPSSPFVEERLEAASFEMNPNSGGRPAIDAAAMDATTTTGIAAPARQLPQVAGARLLVDDADDHEQRGLEHAVGQEERHSRRRSPRRPEPNRATMKPSWLTVP